MANNVYSDYAMNVRLGNYQIINAVQGEVNTRWVTVNFMNDNIPYDLTGLLPTINMIKSDNTTIFNNGIIIDAPNGQAKFLITSQMTIFAGTFNVFFEIFGDTPTSELKITGFQLIVEPANSDTGIVSSNEYTALQALIAQVQPAIDLINQTVADSAQAIADANAAAVYANKYGTQAKNVPYVGVDLYWYMWNSTTNAYEKTNIFASTNYATFEIDPVTGILYEITPDTYTGAGFQINSNGELEAVV